MSEVRIASTDGWSLSLGKKEPESEPKGVVVLGHAMMANRRSLDRPEGQGLASTLNAHGLLTYAIDARGHGGSGPRPHEGGAWSYDDLVLRDLPSVLEFVRAEHPTLPLAFLGHSLTAHGILAMLGQKPELEPLLDAVVSLAGNVWLPALEPRRLRWAKKWANLLLFEMITAVRGYFPARRLKMGSEDVSAGFVGMFKILRRRGRWSSLDGSIDYWSGLPRIRQRVLAVVGRADHLFCHPESSELFHQALRSSRVWHWTVGTGEHGLSYDPDHMTLVTDTRSSPLWNDLAGWLLERFAERGSPLQPAFLSRP